MQHFRLWSDRTCIRGRNLDVALYIYTLPSKMSLPEHGIQMDDRI